MRDEKTYNTVQVADTLLSVLALLPVGLVFVRDGKIQALETFLDFAAGRVRISELMLDASVTNMWVGAQSPADQDVLLLIQELNQQRGMNGFRTATRGPDGPYRAVWDLDLAQK